MKNLSHSASLHSRENIAPSKSGIKHLAKGEADLGVRMMQPSEPDLIARKAFEVGWCIVASSDYAKNYGLPETAKDLSRHRLILYTEDRLNIPGFAWLEQFRGCNANFSRVSRIDVALRRTLAGAGISALPAYEILTSLPLVRVFADPVVPQQGFVVYHESQRDSARIHAVADGLLEYFDERRTILSGTSQKKL